MRSLFLILFISQVLLCCGQKIPADLADRIKQVENNLAPDLVFGDTVPHLNLLEQMKAYEVRGLTIAVIRNYQLDWAKAYGWADEEDKRPATTETRFQAASISKSLNSLGLLKLIQLGKIELETDINTYLKSWQFPYDSLSRGKKISLANLLSHTAGLSVHGFAGYAVTDSIPTLIQVLDGQRPANSRAVRSMFEPGKRFQYSGGGTSISQLMLTDITGKRYEEYMKAEVLQPLGMSNSFFTQPPATGTKELASAYREGKAMRGKFHVYPEQAAAGLWTTPTDLSKYIIETQLAYEGRSAKVLNKAMMQKRLSTYIDSNAALGVFIVKKGENTYFNHNGGNEGFLCTSYGSLKDGNGVVIMINSDRFNIIAELLNSVAQVYGWKGFYQPIFRKVYYPAKDTLTAYTGNYLLFSDTISLRRCGEGLCVWQNGQPPAGLKMIFTNATEFSVAEIPNASIRMIYTEGKVSSFELTQGGQKMIAKKID